MRTVLWPPRPEPTDYPHHWLVLSTVPGNIAARASKVLPPSSPGASEASGAPSASGMGGRTLLCALSWSFPGDQAFRGDMIDGPSWASTRLLANTHRLGGLHLTPRPAGRPTWDGA